VPQTRIGEIVAGTRAITAETDLLLCKFFGLSEGWWLSLQGRYDLAMAHERIDEQLQKVQPFAMAA
jgi:addiction module HigA family antidote